MMLHQYLETIAPLVNDDAPGQMFQRYTKKFIIDSLNAGLSFISGMRRDLFNEYHIVKLRTGSLQDVRNELDIVDDVTAQTDADGNIIYRLSGSRANPAQTKSTWSKPPILVDSLDAGFVITSANIDASANGRFTVSPPVPPGVDVYVQIKGFREPSISFSEDEDYTLTYSGDVLTALQYFVMSRCALMDRNPTAHGAYLQTFLSLLRYNEQNERLAESGLAFADAVTNQLLMRSQVQK